MSYPWSLINLCYISINHSINLSIYWSIFLIYLLINYRIICLSLYLSFYQSTNQLLYLSVSSLSGRSFHHRMLLVGCWAVGCGWVITGGSGHSWLCSIRSPEQIWTRMKTELLFEVVMFPSLSVPLSFLLSSFSLSFSLSFFLSFPHFFYLYIYMFSFIYFHLSLIYFFLFS